MKRKIVKIEFHDSNEACGMNHRGSILAEVINNSKINCKTFHLKCYSYEDYRCGDICRGYIKRTITSVVPISVDQSVMEYIKPLSIIRNDEIHYQ